MIRARHILAAAVVAGMTALVSAPALAAPCVSEGAILDVPTPGYLRSETPNLVLDFERGGTVIPISTLSMTTSRIRVRLPSTGLPSDAKFKVQHVAERGAPRVIASGRTCGAAATSGSTAEATSGSTVSTTRRSFGGFVAATPRARLTPATRFDVMAPSGAPEIVLMGDTRAIARAEGIVRQAGGTVLRRRSLDSLGLGMIMVDMAGLLTEAELRSELRRRGANVDAGRHNVYRLSGASTNYARRIVTGDEATACRLSRTVRIGVIDGPVNTNHPALRGASIETATVLDRQDVSASADHGTGIAGLIVSPEFGLAPGAALFAVTAVSRAGTREVAKLEDVAAALDFMVARKVDVVNMSLAGPPNEALARAIEGAASKGIVLVAAVGNDSSSDVAYPASDQRVIAVTAVDAEKRLYRKASRGTAVDFAAPGVDVRVPTASRMAFKSGTSYASAALTALVALELANGGARSTGDVRRALERIAEDLGASGRDTEFGLGLPRRSGC